MKHSFKKSMMFVMIALTLAFSAVGVTPAHGGGGVLHAKPSATGTGDCSSWANACTLQTALTGAISGNEIWVKAGTHKPTTAYSRTATFQLKSGVAVYGGFAGTETDLSQRDPAANVTTLSGFLSPVTGNSYHVVTGTSGATLDGFTIRDGQANGASPDHRGGGIYNDVSSPTLRNLVISGNSAEHGGGIYNGQGNPTLTNVTFSGNSADYGGGMSNISSSPTLTNVTFSGNTAAHLGGGMYNYNGSSPTLANVTFSGNSATYSGSGMYNNNNSNPSLTNVTFSGNSGNSADYGGGMSNISSSPTLTNVTFSGNSATSGGGMHNTSDSHPTLRNTLIANSASGGDCVNDAGGSLNAASSNNLVEDSANACGLTNGMNSNIVGLDPNLGPLQNNGGDTLTHALLPGSPAIDTGDDAVCPADDQRGRLRPQGAQCDIGAYEANATLTVRSVGTYDGWILESGENTTVGGTLDSTATTFNLGDGTLDKQYRAILHFNTVTLPDTAVITKVTLKIRKQGLVGTDPFTILGGLKVDMRKPFFGTAGLVISDFQVAAGKSAVATFNATPVSNWYSALLNATGRAYVNKTGNTQFRLYFVTDDNNDNAADYMKFFSGNHATASARPTLIIEYYVPVP